MAWGAHAPRVLDLAPSPNRRAHVGGQFTSGCMRSAGRSTRALAGPFSLPFHKPRKLVRWPAAEEPTSASLGKTTGVQARHSPANSKPVDGRRVGRIVSANQMLVSSSLIMPKYFLSQEEVGHPLRRQLFRGCCGTTAGDQWETQRTHRDDRWFQLRRNRARDFQPLLHQTDQSLLKLLSLSVRADSDLLHQTFRQVERRLHPSTLNQRSHVVKSAITRSWSYPAAQTSFPATIVLTARPLSSHP